MDENLLTISQLCELTHFWERSIVTLAIFGPNSMFSFLSKGAYHLSELTDPGELVVISPNGKQRANLRDFAHEPCVGYAQ